MNNRRQVYDRVTEAWKTALKTINKIVAGAAYSVQDGAVLAALLAPHLYADILVLIGTFTTMTLDPIWWARCRPT